MLERIRQWIERRKGRQIGEHDFSNLPEPKTSGNLLLDDCRLIILDLETTGLNPARDEVIAIGAVAIQGGVIHLDDQFDLILRRPELNIDETVLIHGIGNEALTHGHETQDALLYLLEWMNGDPILAYHSAFDQKFLEKALKLQIGYTRNHLWMDAADLLPALFPDIKPGGKGLDHWAEHFGLEFSTRHHAAADAMATAELTLIAINKAIKDGVKTVEQLNTKLQYHRRLQNMHRF
ncbi:MULTISPECIES: PolC-type DNA polymerase III [Marinobacter]|uniref:DNA-directed DNA polymerase n=1 Tax=Marinobacter suaedae TaxID=3057675 RepID=A0ABT8W0T7_9GAMM|nr:MULTISPECIES: 3'-5' exonuclease [unclassified Marinobacter]MBZ2169850.1 3'-5' exonuclease [Marinobacter sp. F4216]MDO3721830.1 3'-5' exonuclease [Marinobacter sp. chi1]